MTQPINIICPVTKQGCYRMPQCQHNLDNLLGNTMCAEWILKEQKAGEKEQKAKLDFNEKS